MKLRDLFALISLSSTLSWLPMLYLWGQKGMIASALFWFTVAITIGSLCILIVKDTPTGTWQSNL